MWHNINKQLIWIKQVRPEKIPSTYQEVEYIGANKAQYINTWVNASNTKWVIMKFLSTDVADDNIIFWSNSSWDSRFVIGNANNQVYIAWNTKNFANISVNTVYTVELNFLNSRKAIFNWTTLSSNLWTLSSSNTYETTIFCGNYWWTRNFLFRGRLYYMRISDGGQIVRDFVPCYRKSDWVIWLYDLVNKQFYTNSWSWTFTKWSDVN